VHFSAFVNRETPQRLNIYIAVIYRRKPWGSNHQCGKEPITGGIPKYGAKPGCRPILGPFHGLQVTPATINRPLMRTGATITNGRQGSVDGGFVYKSINIGSEKPRFRLGARRANGGNNQGAPSKLKYGQDGANRLLDKLWKINRHWAQESPKISECDQICPKIPRNTQKCSKMDQN